MSSEENHIHSTLAESIRRYLSGKMSPDEMYALEKEALENPFLADAIEGMQTLEQQRLDPDMVDLHARLNEKVSAKVIRMPVPVRWLRVAIAAAVLVIAGTTSYYLLYNDPEKNITARVEEKAAPAAAESENALPQRDSISVADPLKPASEKNSTTTAKAGNTNKSLPEPVQKEQEARSSRPDQHEVATALHPPAETFKQDEKNRPVVVNEGSNVPAAVPEALRLQKSESGAAGGSLFYFTGNIMDINNQPVSFANISIKNSNSVAYADAKGNFRLMAADSMVHIDIRSVGYITNSTVLSYRHPGQRLIMTPADKTLNDVTILKKKKYSLRAEAIDAKDSTDTVGLPEAEPADGWGPYQLYLLNNTRQQKDGNAQLVTGTVVVSFLVNEMGWLSEFKIEQSLCTGCDREAIRLIREGPKWVLYNSDIPLRAKVTVVF